MAHHYANLVIATALTLAAFDALIVGTVYSAMRFARMATGTVRTENIWELRRRWRRAQLGAAAVLIPLIAALAVWLAAGPLAGLLATVVGS